MRIPTGRSLILSALVASAAATLLIAARPSDAARQPALPGIPASDARLIDGYRSWQPLARPPVASLRGLGSAHAADRKRVYINRTRAQIGRRGTRGVPYARGTVVVKELRIDDYIEAVAIMQKVRGSRDGGWRWVEYKRSAGTAPFRRLQLSGSFCSGCHMQATRVQRSDGVFWRLR
jgi:hypothetical protein